MKPISVLLFTLATFVSNVSAGDASVITCMAGCMTLCVGCMSIAGFFGAAAGCHNAYHACTEACHRNYAHNSLIDL